MKSKRQRKRIGAEMENRMKKSKENREETQRRERRRE